MANLRAPAVAVAPPGLGVVAAQPAAAELGLVEDLEGLLGVLDGEEVGVGEAARPAGGAVDRDADVLEVLQLLEDGVEVRVRGLVRDVADVDRRRRRPDFPGHLLARRVARPHVDAAAVPERLVGALDRAVHGHLVREPDETETARPIVSQLKHYYIRHQTLIRQEARGPVRIGPEARARWEERMLRIMKKEEEKFAAPYPLLRPRASLTMRMSTISPYWLKASFRCTSVASKVMLLM